MITKMTVFWDLHNTKLESLRVCRTQGVKSKLTSGNQHTINLLDINSEHLTVSQLKNASSDVKREKRGN